jgi:hypothetical protein
MSVHPRGIAYWPVASGPSEFLINQEFIPKQTTKPDLKSLYAPFVLQHPHWRVSEYRRVTRSIPKTLSKGTGEPSKSSKFLIGVGWHLSRQLMDCPVNPIV